jgi:hypothetical protein
MRSRVLPPERELEHLIELGLVHESLATEPRLAA